MKKLLENRTFIIIASSVLVAVIVAAAVLTSVLLSKNNAVPVVKDPDASSNLIKGSSSGTSQTSSGSSSSKDPSSGTSSNSAAVSSKAGTPSKSPSPAPASSAAPAPTPSQKPGKDGLYDSLTADQKALVDRVRGLNNTRQGYSFSYGDYYKKGIPITSIENDRLYRKYGMHSIEETDEKVIYLTFDAGYEFRDCTTRILNSLKSHNATATFFIVRSYAQTHHDLVSRMINEGHVVGNHSTSHPQGGMPTVSPEKCVTEIMTMHNYMKERFNYEMHLFRPPEGAFSTRTLAITQGLGYKTIEWSFAYGDYDDNNQPDPDEAFALIKRFTGPGRIFLLHATSWTNAIILDRVLDYWQSEGYTVIAYPNEPA